jgi:hypothetical protein
MGRLVKEPSLIALKGRCATPTVYADYQKPRAPPGNDICAAAGLLINANQVLRVWLR